eukprot:3936256-Rhodomonas_salina.1
MPPAAAAIARPPRARASAHKAAALAQGSASLQPARLALSMPDSTRVSALCHCVCMSLSHTHRL